MKNNFFIVLKLISFILPLSLMITPDLYTQIEYKEPPEEIIELVDAPQIPDISISPDNQWIALFDRPAHPSISEISQPELRFAGIRINPLTNGPSRIYYYSGIKLINITTGKDVVVTGLPENPKIRIPKWSFNSKYLAFTVTFDDGLELWILNTENGEAKPLSHHGLNSAYGTPYHWTSNSENLVVKFIPQNRDSAPTKSPVPEGPIVQENINKVAPSRTYQDLLKNPYDENLLEYYLTSELGVVSLDGNTKFLGEPHMFKKFSLSLNREYILVEIIHRPFSYLVPLYYFPYMVEIWSNKGELIKLLADLPLAEEVPVRFGAVPEGPRKFNWREDAPASVYWVEAQDKGDPKIEIDIRDKIFLLTEPFTGKPVEIAETELRYEGIIWGNENFALIFDYWWADRRTKTTIINPSFPNDEPLVLFDRSWEDRYNDPGSPISVKNPDGSSTLLLTDNGESIFLRGTGATPEGNKPFLNKINLKSKQTQELWRSEAPYFERAIRILDSNGKILLSSRESVKEPPNYFKRDLKNDELQQITYFKNPYKHIENVKKELIKYKRDDGVQLSATLYLPEGYDTTKGRLPVLIWAYPHTFKSSDAAGQVKDSPYRFTRLYWGSPVYWVRLGYAILDYPSMPIIGEGDSEPNDTYIEQLVSSAKAAVDELVRRGIADPNRIAIGGHSYGAFMSANLLAHSDLFVAGIARNGAYNRTLTPFGFQAEERTFWQAPEIYFKMSPFMYADKINEPLLLIHGEADNNSGTFPIQSERFYNALKGHGATARLVMLPLESHQYKSRESILHMMWEINEWLEKYVKNAPN